MSKKRSLVDIFDNDDFTGIRNTGHSQAIKPIPSYITENLKYTPHYFQVEAIENFIFYLEYLFDE